jgi:hypothetical protein
MVKFRGLVEFFTGYAVRWVNAEGGSCAKFGEDAFYVGVANTSVKY